MQIPIAYGKDDHLNLEINEKNLLGVFDPNPVAKFDENGAHRKGSGKSDKSKKL